LVDDDALPDEAVKAEGQRYHAGDAGHAAAFDGRQRIAYFRVFVPFAAEAG
jgi:hypothetical protein